MKMKTGCLHMLNAIVVSAFIFTSCVQAQSQDDSIKRKVGNVCQKDVDCPDNAFCKTVDDRGYCVCKDGYLLHLYNTTHRECIREAKSLGDVCTVDLQCKPRLSVHSVCVDGVCKCKDGAHFDDGRCYETKIIGQSCLVTQNCYLGPDESFSNQVYCVRGICQCNLLHSPRNGGTRCLKDAVLGDPCEDNEHCTGENTRCNSVCRCIDGHVLHPDENRCLKAAVAFNDPCEIESQCTANLNGSSCIDQHCNCQWGFHMSDGRCWGSKYSGQRCSRNQECLTDANEPGQCVRGICTCRGCEVDNSGSSFSTSAFVFLVTFIISIIAGPCQS